MSVEEGEEYDRKRNGRESQSHAETETSGSGLHSPQYVGSMLHKDFFVVVLLDKGLLP